jgi:hypothetical protein
MYLNSVMSQQLLLCLSVLLVSFYVASPKKVDAMIRQALSE